MPPIDLPEEFLDSLDNISQTSITVHSRRKRSVGSQSVQTLKGQNGEDMAYIFLEFDLDGYKGNDNFFDAKTFFFYQNPEISSSRDVIYFDPGDKKTIEIKVRFVMCTEVMYYSVIVL